MDSFDISSFSKILLCCSFVSNFLSVIKRLSKFFSFSMTSREDYALLLKIRTVINETTEKLKIEINKKL